MELGAAFRPVGAGVEGDVGRRIGAGKERSRHRLSLFHQDISRSKERREEDHRRSKGQSFACTPSPTALRSRGQSAASVAEAFARGFLQHRLAGVERTWERYFVAHLLKRSVRRSMFSSQKVTLLSTAFFMLSGPVADSFSTVGRRWAVASLFEVP